MLGHCQATSLVEICLRSFCSSPTLINANSSVPLCCNNFPLAPSKTLGNVLASMGPGRVPGHPAGILLRFHHGCHSLFCSSLSPGFCSFLLFCKYSVSSPTNVQPPLCAGSSQKALKTPCTLINWCSFIYLWMFSNKVKEMHENFFPLLK